MFSESNNKNKLKKIFPVRNCQGKKNQTVKI